MQAFEKKLKNNQGVTILLAMVLMLIAIMVCSGILGASLTGAYRLKSSRQEQQDAQLLRSALRLVKEDVSNAEVNIKAWSYIGYSANGNGHAWGHWVGSGNFKKKNTPPRITVNCQYFKANLEHLVYYTFQNRTSSAYAVVSKAMVSFPDSGLSTKKDVYVYFRMKTGYQLDVYVSFMDVELTGSATVAKKLKDEEYLHYTFVATESGTDSMRVNKTIRW